MSRAYAKDAFRVMLKIGELNCEQLIAHLEAMEIKYPGRGWGEQARIIARSKKQSPLTTFIERSLQHDDQ